MSTEAPRALILGISGQDGSYLAKHLLALGYDVFGTSRDAEASSFSRLNKLGICKQVSCSSVALGDFRDLLNAVTEIQPDEIYNLAGQSSVGLSFSQPVETFDSIAMGNLHVLEVLRYLNQSIRYYNAGSSECFGPIEPGDECDESTALRPLSPYAVAKATAFWQTDNYRKAFGVHACTGILFNHESPLRPERFVTQKIVRAAVRIAAGSEERLSLGDIDIQRDWGHAAEYVIAMHAMLQKDIPRDYVIATGQTHSLREFLDFVFVEVGLSWSEHVDLDPALHRPNELRFSAANPQRAADELGWRANTMLPKLAESLVAAERDRIADRKQSQ